MVGSKRVNWRIRFLVHLLYKELAYSIVGCALQVHKTLGSGFLESVYEEALKVELKFNGIHFESQKWFPITYRGQEIKTFYCDLVIEDKVIVELKAIKKLGDIERAQAINYLKVTGLQLALLMNFGETSFVSERLVLSNNNKRNVRN